MSCFSGAYSKINLFAIKAYVLKNKISTSIILSLIGFFFK